MTLKQEAAQIIKNAKAALHKGEITREQYRNATRIPLKDIYLIRGKK